MNEGVITDEAMKEMAEQLKEKYDEIISGNKKLLEQNVNLKKDLITLYSLLRIIDNLIDDEDVDTSIRVIVELGRGLASTMLDHYIFNG